MSHMQAELSIQELDKAMKATSDKNMYKRYQAVRLHFDGLMNIDIANIIQVHPQTVGIYIRKYKEQGLSALTPAPKPGAPPKLSKEQEKQLKDTMYPINKPTSKEPDLVYRPYQTLLGILQYSGKSSDHGSILIRCCLLGFSPSFGSSLKRYIKYPNTSNLLREPLKIDSQS